MRGKTCQEKIKNISVKVKTLTELTALGLGKNRSGCRASQRVHVEIEIYALEGGGGEELLAGGKEEIAHTRGAVAGGYTDTPCTSQR